MFALLGLSACGGMPGDAVVQVGGNPITKTAFEHWMTVAAASSALTAGEKPVIPVPPKYTACIAHLAATAPKPAKGQSAPTTAQLKTECEQQYKSLQSEVLGFLISSQWVLDEAKSLGVKLSDAEVHKEFEKIKNAQFPKAAEFEKFLQTSGQSVSDLLLRVKLNMLSRKSRNRWSRTRPRPREAQITKYYNENKSRFGTPEKRTVRIILTKTEAQAIAAKKEIESGKSFAIVAEKDSIDPTSKADGGLLKEVVKGEEEKALDEAIFTAKVSKLGGPGEDAVRLLHLRSGEHHRRHQQSLAQVEVHDQTAADRHQPAESSQHVRQELQKEVAGTDRMPLRLRGSRLQGLQSAEDDVENRRLHRRIGDSADACAGSGAHA